MLSLPPTWVKCVGWAWVLYLLPMDALFRCILGIGVGLALLAPAQSVAGQDENAGLFLAAGFTGYTIAPIQSQRDNPYGIAFRPELHRNITFMARAAKHHAVGVAFDFVGIDVPKKWRRLMATYAFKDLLIRFQTGRIAGRMSDGEAFSGPYFDAIVVGYTDFAAFGMRYTSGVRPMTTHKTGFDELPVEYALDRRAHIESIGPIMFTDRMFEAVREGRIDGAGRSELARGFGTGLDPIVMFLVSRMSHSLAYRQEYTRTLSTEAPLSYTMANFSSEIRPFVMWMPEKGGFAGSAGGFVKHTLAGSGSAEDDLLTPGLQTEFHFGPFVRIGGIL